MMELLEGYLAVLTLATLLTLVALVGWFFS